MMNEESRHDLRTRTKRFALDVIAYYTSLPRTTEAQVLGRQLLRSATSVGAHYREATRSRSTAEFVSKIEVALQELEESVYWMELLAESKVGKMNLLGPILQEAEELISIFVSSAKTAKKLK